MAARVALGLCLASTWMACSKNVEKVPEKAVEKAPEVGCGKDYGDPQKVFCVTLPTGYEADPHIESDELYSELIHFKGPNMGDGLTVAVGFSSSNYTTYEQQLASDEEVMKMARRKVESSGATPGNQGKWWLYTDSGIRTLSARAKAANGKPVGCDPSNSTPSPEAVEACKSIRPFPTKL